jgi:hypothetical protein
MTKQTKNYTDMDNEEKAQVIYNTLLRDQPDTGLPDLILDLTLEYADDVQLYTSDEMLEYYNHIRESIYYAGYTASTNIGIDLIDESEVIEWIANALDDELPCIEELDSMMKAKH